MPKKTQRQPFGLSDVVQQARLQNSPTPAGGMEADGGVTVFWLAKTFSLEVATVRKKLATCPTLRNKTSGKIYAIGEAARFLVVPNLDLAAHLASLKPADIPVQLTGAYWGGQMKRQEFMVQAGQLWSTQRVIESVGELFKTMKNTMQLWTDTLERQTGLTDEQRKLLVRLIDGLQDDLYRSIEKMATQRVTTSELGDIQEAEDSYDDLL